MDLHKKLEQAKQQMLSEFLKNSGYDLTKKGRVHVMSSPFNDEREPSMIIYDNVGRQEGWWIDYSSGKRGDIVNFVMETQNLSTSEAVDVILENDFPKPKKRRIKKDRVVPIELDKYIESDENNLRMIRRYAESRKIPEHHYIPGLV